MATDMRIDQDKLHQYLSEHLLGSRSGLEHFKAAVETWQGTANEQRLISLENQVHTDQEDLKRIIAQLGFEEHKALKLFAPLAWIVGRFNPFNPSRMRRLSLAQVQLDVLTGLLNAKLRMWRTLELMVPEEPRLDPDLLADLARRAEDQISQLCDISNDSWKDRFIDKG